MANHGITTTGATVAEAYDKLYYVERAAKETMDQRERLAALGARVFAVDAAAYFSRPGPRLVDGVELLGHLLHSDLVPAPPTRRSIELDLERPASVS